ncbi:transposable element Tcb2 transposase [Trichonephila clavipes]|nr:transposable element Tcb2 transposase [Trichonephila clavipes]
MQPDCVLRIAGRGHLTSFSVEYKTGCSRETSRRKDRHIVRNARVQPTASLAAIQTQVTPSLETLVSSRTIRRRLAEGHLGTRCPLRVLPLMPPIDASAWSSTAHEETGLKWNKNQVVFSDESRFNLSSDDSRVPVWRPRCERLYPAFALQRHTTPTAGVLVWGPIAYNIRSPLVLIHGTMIAQQYIHESFNHMCYHSCNSSPRSHFSIRQCLASHGKGVTRPSPHCY